MAAAVGTNVMGIQSNIFTRGGPDVPDNRGESMVQKHLEKLQKDKEVAALQKIKAAIPEVGSAVHALALEQCGWEVDAALNMLQMFAVDKSEELAELNKKRKRISTPEIGEPSASETDSEEETQRHKKKGKRSRKEKKHRSSKKDSRSKRKKKDNALGAVTAQFGKYGIIRESDLYAKRGEFQLWAMEVPKVDVESLPRGEEKELFKTYMEDYNTGTLPHKKYYDLDAYEHAKALKRAKTGRAEKVEKTFFNDEEERRRELARERAEEHAERLKEAYNQLKYTAPEKAADMREQEMLRMQMNLAYRTGDTTKAKQISDRLMPDAQRELLVLKGEMAPAKGGP